MDSELEIDGRKVIVSYDDEIGMYRGEYTELAGGADFYAAAHESLKVEGRASLKLYLEMKIEKGLNSNAKV